MSRINIDVEATNKLRWEYKDGEIAKMLNCSIASIQKYCGTRKSYGIPYITKSHIVPDIIPIMERSTNPKKKQNQELLKQDKWVYNVEIPYWMNDEVIISGDSPMRGIKFEKNTIGHPYF